MIFIDIKCSNLQSISCLWLMTEKIFTWCPTFMWPLPWTACPGGLPMSGASGTFTCQFWECRSHAANVCASGTQGAAFKATSDTSATSGTSGARGNWIGIISFPNADHTSGVLEFFSDFWFKGGPRKFLEVKIWTKNGSVKALRIQDRPWIPNLVWGISSNLATMGTSSSVHGSSCPNDVSTSLTKVGDGDGLQVQSST